MGIFECLLLDPQKTPLDIENSAGNLKIPLANGNVMNIPLSAINITEEVNKTGIWKQVNKNNSIGDKEKKKSPLNSRFNAKKKKPKREEKVVEKTKLEKRLSTMTEEEEDDGITIKCEQFKDKNWKERRKSRQESDETHV